MDPSARLSASFLPRPPGATTAPGDRSGSGRLAGPHRCFREMNQVYARRLRLLSMAAILRCAHCCSNVIVSGSASADGFPMIGYNADSAALHGAISHWPAAKHAPGTMREIYSWDLGWKLGEIPEAATTYNVIGNANDQGLVIGETTLGGLTELSNVGKDARNGTILDYGQLIYVTLQRAATAREAIATMHELTSKYGYASDMEGFSIGDARSGEVWYMEVRADSRLGSGLWLWLWFGCSSRHPDSLDAAHPNPNPNPNPSPSPNHVGCHAAGVVHGVHR